MQSCKAIRGTVVLEGSSPVQGMAGVVVNLGIRSGSRVRSLAKTRTDAGGTRGGIRLGAWDSLPRTFGDVHETGVTPDLEARRSAVLSGTRDGNLGEILRTSGELSETQITEFVDHWVAPTDVQDTFWSGLIAAVPSLTTQAEMDGPRR